MITAMLFAAALATASAASDPAAPATAPVAVQAATAPDANKVICHSEEVTGSRLGNVRVCMTKAQWDERSANDRATLETTVNAGRMTGGPH